MRKFKKVAIVLLITVMFFTFSIKAFAENTTNNVVNNSVNNADNKVSRNNTNNIIDEESLIPALEEKLKQKENKKDTVNSKSNKILEDIVVIENNKNVEYKDIYIDGNIFIISAKKVTFENVIVNGSIFGVCKEIEIENSKIDSIYCTSNILNIDENCKINKELRFIGNEFEFNGIVERDLYSVSKTLNIKEDAKIGQDLIVRAENSSVSKEAEIEGKKDIIIADISEVELEISLENILWEMLTGFIIIVITSIFILGGFPKFTEVNNNLKLRNFFTTFFTGILELVIAIAITIGICIWGYGIGYGIAFSLLVITLLGLGKIIFVVSFSIRMNADLNKPSRLKAFMGVIFVAIIVEAINLLSLLGYTGAMIVFVINIAIGISGFGSLVKVILSPRPNKNVNTINNTGIDISSDNITSKGEISEVKDIEINNVSINNLEIKKSEESEKTKEEPKEETNNNED